VQRLALSPRLLRKYITRYDISETGGAVPTEICAALSPWRLCTVRVTVAGDYLLPYVLRIQPCVVRVPTYPWHMYLDT